MNEADSAPYLRGVNSKNAPLNFTFSGASRARGVDRAPRFDSYVATARLRIWTKF